MLNTIAKRIQTRLSKLGVKFSLSDIRPVVEQMITDVENASAEEINKVVDHFLDISTQLTVIDGSDVDNVENIDNVNTLSIQSDETGSNQDEIRGNQNNQETLVTSNNLHPNEAAQHTETAPLATTEKSELVSTTADQMGIVLNASEISLIAENINESTDTLEEDIDTIKSAIMAFIEHKAIVAQTKITNMISEVRETVSAKNQENSQLLSDGLSSINSDIQEANKDFKSNVQKCLKAFDIPTLKAG